MNKSVLMIFNANPYDGTDTTWNGLRLAEKLLDLQLDVNIFLMNDSVDLARDKCKPPEEYFDLVEMMKELIAKGITVKVCGTCRSRCGVFKNEPYFKGAMEAKMTDLAVWIKEADKIINL